MKHSPTCSSAKANGEVGQEAFGCTICNGEVGFIMLDACGLCACGSGDDGDLLFDCLLWAVTRNEEANQPEPFGKSGFYCSPGHELTAKILDKSELLEHGSGIGWAWPTEKGKALIAWIQERPR